YIKDLLPLIDDDNEHVRSDAIYTLSCLGDKSLVETILPKLEDGNPHVRLITIRALVKLGGPAMVKEHNLMKPILDLLENEYTVELAIKTLGELGDKSVIKELLPLMKDKETRIVLDAAYALVRLDGPLVIKEYGLLGDILTILKDKREENEYRRGEAVQLLGRLNDRSLVKYILPLLNDKSKYVRSQVIRALEASGDKAIIKDLLPIVSNDVNPQIRLETALIIHKLGGPSAIREHSVARQILSCLQDINKNTQTDTLTVLGRLGDNSVAKEIIPMLKDADEKIELSAAWALAQLKDIRALPVLIEAIDRQGSFYEFAPGGGHYLSPLSQEAQKGLEKLTGKIMPGSRTDKEQMVRNWKDWWAKDGKTWYEEEVKKIKE
ncbi:MAG: HEAT repeat domain-containing protein, partial [Planctomycetota bacterium]